MILPPLIERPACATACWIERSGYWFAIGLTLILFLAMASVYPRFAVRFAVSGTFAKIVTGLGSGPGSRYQRRQRKKVAQACPIGVPSRVVRVLALMLTEKPQENQDAEISIYPTECAADAPTETATAFPSANAGNVRRIQRLEGEVQGQYRRHGRETQGRRQGRDGVRRD